jgi:glutamate N-acetyltransferase/amino-acid N-acetyltransferase
MTKKTTEWVMREIRGGVCAPKGFRSSAVAAEIKIPGSDRLDLALVASVVPAQAAGVFTKNLVKAAPVMVSQKNLRSRFVRAVLLNSGNANACTGKQGHLDCLEKTRAVSECLGVRQSNILVCSTGRIGRKLPMKRILPKIPDLCAKLRVGNSLAVARAIMTSDTFAKQSAREVRLTSGTVCIGGVAKGAGMINPNMATMLCVLTTDVLISSPKLRAVLREVVDQTFNRITVDGDMSTNDTVLLLANGESGVAAESESDVELFTAAVRAVCTELARMIVRDGEGTSKVIELEVRRARSDAEARRAAEAAANSILLKCAWAGGDPNWGRILDAVGYSGARFNPDRVAVFYEDVPVVADGVAVDANERAVKKIAARKEFKVVVDLGAGFSDYTVLTTDLTEEYVRLNLSE